MAKKKKAEHEAIVDNETAKRQESEGRHILVLSNGVPAGVLSEYKNGYYVFAYLMEYSGPPVSLTMPVKKQAFSFDRFPAFFDAFLPEAKNCEEFLKRTGLERDDYMSQLLAVGRHGTISVEEYETAKKTYLSSPQLPLKGRKEKYPSRDELHDRGGRKKGFDFWKTIDRLSAPKPTNLKDLNKWAMERNKIDRLARDLRLLGISVFEDSAEFDEWLQAEIPALGCVRPCTLLGTAEGIQELINELGRIEYGVIS
jgi:serine/threonine-protein kinase HipA